MSSAPAQREPSADETNVAAVAGGSWPLWSNAVRAEVYALQAVLSRPDVDPARIVYFGESIGSGAAAAVSTSALSRVSKIAQP